MSTDDLDAIATMLTTRELGRSLEVKRVTTSTMDDARQALAHGAATGHVIVADHQTVGRGTHGRAWSSPSGTDLYVSFVARPTMPLERLPTMALAVGVGIARGIEAFVDAARVRQKWPNDVLVDGQKCVGILVETRATAEGVDGVIVGFGINVNRVTFDVETSPAGPTPTSIALARGESVSRAGVLAEVLREVERAIDTWAREPLEITLAAVEEKLAFRGQRVHVDVDEAAGTLVGLSPEGGLRIVIDGSERCYLAGRVTLAHSDTP